MRLHRPMYSGLIIVSGCVLAACSHAATPTPRFEGIAGDADSSSMSVSGPAATIEELTGGADTIVEVDISEFGDYRFNTSTGEAPDPTPEWPDDSTLRGRVLRLEASEPIKGGDPDTAGYIVWVLDDSDEEWVGAGSHGLVFLMDIPPEYVGDPFPFLTAIVDRANELSEPGQTYEPALIWNWFRFEGANAIDTDTHTTLPIADLLSQIHGFLPTPTP